jgi:K+-sensing histidine kinase KdpD
VAPDEIDGLRKLVHDVRTPLAVVRGFADLLERRGDSLSAEQRAQYLARIREAAAEIDEILDKAR